MTMRRLGSSVLPVLVLLQLVSGQAIAQGLFEQATSTPAEDSNESLAPAPLTFEWNGYLRGGVFLGKTPDLDQGEVKNGFGEMALSVRVRKGEWGDAFGEFRLWHGSDMGVTETRINLRETYVNAYLGPLDLRIGQQVIVWGRADGINPTNNLTPVDMRVRSANEDDKRMGNLAVRLSGFFHPIRLEAIWIPLYAASHLPDIQFSEVLSFADPDNPANDLFNGTVAGRITLEASAIDGSISYLYGYAPLPGVAFKDLALDGGTPTISVAFKPYRQHVVGLDFSTTISHWFGLRGEAAYKHPDEDGNPDYEPLPEFHYVLGVDKQIGNFMGVVQYIGRYTMDWTQLPEYGIDLSAGAPDMAEMAKIDGGPMAVIQSQLSEKNRMVRGQLNQWTHMVMSRLAWSLLYETLDLEVMGMYDFLTEEWFARASAGYDLADALTIVVGGEVWGGPEGTMFGTIDELMSAGFLELKASF